MKYPNKKTGLIKRWVLLTGVLLTDVYCTCDTVLTVNRRLVLQLHSNPITSNPDEQNSLL